MTHEIRKFLTTLRAVGFRRADAQRIVKLALSRLSLEERAAIGLAFKAEDQAYADALVALLRRGGRKFLPRRRAKPEAP
jgi:hypothetical protein